MVVHYFLIVSERSMTEMVECLTYIVIFGLSIWSKLVGISSLVQCNISSVS